MLTIPGCPALSDFRINNLLLRLQAIAPGIQAIAGQFEHFVDVESALTDDQQVILESLLAYGAAHNLSLIHI